MYPFVRQIPLYSIVCLPEGYIVILGTYTRLRINVKEIDHEYIYQILYRMLETKPQEKEAARPVTLGADTINSAG